MHLEKFAYNGTGDIVKEKEISTQHQLNDSTGCFMKQAVNIQEHIREIKRLTDFVLGKQKTRQ